MNESITLFTPEGDSIRYRRLSARLPEFLEAYPPRDGYRVEVRYLDPVEVKPGLKRLYEAALTAGKTPAEAGLPALAATTVIFRAELIDAEGRMLATASALRPIQSYKDWEKGETAARQRLLAALGFGGEVFDEDEAGDQEDQGLRRQDRPQARAEQRPSEPQPAPQERPAVSEPIPASLLRQIDHQARLKGVEPPAVASAAEANAALKRLLGA
jgi:hypothetical protein